MAIQRGRPVHGFIRTTDPTLKWAPLAQSGSVTPTGVSLAPPVHAYVWDAATSAWIPMTQY